MSFIYWDKTKNVNLENYTLILPSISVGNVGQLAVDLLLNNLKVESIAYVHNPCFLPIAGADPFNPNSKQISTSCQMYECKEKKIVIIQHRSPLVSKRVSEYMKFLVDFIKDHKIKKTIMLSSCFSQFFTFEQLNGVLLHYLCTGNLKQEETFKALPWKKFNLGLEETSSIPGGGIAKSFFDICEKENIPLVLLILVCSEGDNYPEAYQMAGNLNNWLHLREEDPTNVKWKMPFSWTMPYGRDAPSEVY